METRKDVSTSNKYRRREGGGSDRDKIMKTGDETGSRE
jgi:hypothetical protein